MEDVELTKVVDAWIAAQTAEAGSVKREHNEWAIDHLISSALDADGDFLWSFVRTAYQRDLPDRVVAVLAAGPLEDLLAKRGTEFIDRVEELARKDPKFNDLLGGVWRNTMSDEVWQRVQSIRNHVW
jgi:hypothetical protein